MLELLYAGGLRVSEVAGARLEDLKLDLGYILVHGKGDKERMVPLGVPAQQALQQYLKSGREVLAKKKSSPLLFLGVGARRLSRQRLWQLVGQGVTRSVDATPARTCCVTPARRTWLRTEPTSAPCKPSSATPIFRRRRFIRTLRSTV